MNPNPDILMVVIRTPMTTLAGCMQGSEVSKEDTLWEPSSMQGHAMPEKPITRGSTEYITTMKDITTLPLKHVQQSNSRPEREAA